MAEDPFPIRAIVFWSKSYCRSKLAVCNSFPWKSCSPGILGHFHALY
jgi:hypothetical protein